MLVKLDGVDASNAKMAPIGFSGDTVYIIDCGYQGKDVVIKMSKREEVMYEGENLKWLKEHTKVPTVYDNGYVDGFYYTIMEKLPGVMFQELFLTLSVEEVIIKYAKVLRQFHQIDPSGLPHNHTLLSKQQEVYDNVIQNKVKEQYFEREIRHLNAQEVYSLLQQYANEDTDLVLCHGDVSMPNIMMHNNTLSGFIDIVQIGICDRYVDIAIALRTIRYNIELYGYNFEQKHQDLFLKTYGIEVLDKRKVSYYFLLDELMVG